MADNKPIINNGLFHPYHLNESTFIFRGIRSNFSILFHFSMKFLQANRIAPDETPPAAASQLPPSAASQLGLFCLPVPHEKDSRLK